MAKGGNGKGGGGGGGGGDTSAFALDPYSGNGSVTGTGDPSVGDVTVRITANDGTIFEGTATWVDGTWSFDLSTAVNINDPTDGFADESGSFTVVAYYMQQKGKNLRPVYSNEIQIDYGNAAPVAADDSATVDEDGAVTLFPLVNDSDPDGDQLTIQSFTQPANGTVTFDSGSDSFTYTPNPDYYGADSFTYTIIDGNGGSSTATVNLTVNPVNDAPVAQEDSATTSEDTAITVDVLANDSDVDGDTLTVSILTAPSHGTAVVNADGTITYTPGTDYAGPDSLTYQISDGNGGTATATLSLTVDPANDPPIALPDTATTAEDTSVTVVVLANDSDPDGDTLTVTIVSGPVNGAATVNADGTITYVPGANYNGDDSLTYQVSDGKGGTATATLSLTVTPVEDPPVAQDDSATTAEDTAVVVSVLANDSDPDGDALTVSIVTEPLNGAAVVNGDGTITYTPGVNYNGGDSLTYEISDGKGGTATAVLSLTVTPVNDAPVAQPDSVTTNEDTAVTVDVLANDSDLDGDPLTVTIVSGPVNGAATVNADGTITYAPGANYNGGDSLTYEISDGQGGTATAVLSLTVTPVNDAPVAAPDTATTERNTAVVIAVLVNDSDPDGDSLAIDSVTQPTNGSVVINPDGTLTYTPGTDYTGDDSFTYTVTDGNGGTATETVTVSVTGAADPVTDPLYAEQWHLSKLGVEAVWPDFSGAGVTIGVYDNGVQGNHEDIKPNWNGDLYVYWNGTLLNDYPADHGTAVLGLIGMAANGLGGVGVAYGSSLTGVQVIGGVADGETNPAGFDYAMHQMDTFDVINMSWGEADDLFTNSLNSYVVSTLSGGAEATALGRLDIDTGVYLGSVLLRASGNQSSGSQGDAMNNTRDVMVIGAYSHMDHVAHYSNRGANLMVVAPSARYIGAELLSASEQAKLGEEKMLVTTDLSFQGYGYDPNAAYLTQASGFGGTSGATPLVSGVVALMLEANPDLGWRDVQEIMAYSARKIEAATATEMAPEMIFGGLTGSTTEQQIEYFGWFENGGYNSNGRGLTYSEDYGFGAADAEAAVRMAEVWSLFWDLNAAPTDPGYIKTSQNELSWTGGSSTTVSNGASTPTLSVYFDYAGPAMSIEYVNLMIDWYFEDNPNVDIDLISPWGTEVSLILSEHGDTLGNVQTNLGAPSPILNGPWDAAWTFGVRAFMGEDPTGTWEIRLTDTVFSGWGNRDTLTVEAFEFTFYGEAVDPIATRDDVYHYTKDMIDQGYYLDAGRVNLSDAGGEDWLNFAALNLDLVVDLREQATSYVAEAQPTPNPAQPLVRLDGGVVEAQPTVIENAVTGDGADHLTGNAAANELHGMRGNDTLAGGANDDELWGGADMDVFEFAVGDGADWIGDFAQAEFDSVTLIGFTGLSSVNDLSFSVVNTTDKLLDLGGGDSITFAGGAGWSFAEQDFTFV